jgi:hypothetical protein
MNTRDAIRTAALFGALAASLLPACKSKKESASEAEERDTRRPGIHATRDISEEAYIYGFPMIAAYKALYELNVDKTSGQYKGGFNEVCSEARVFTPKDTAIVTPNSDTPYSMLQADLRAEPIVLSVPRIEENRYYSVQFCDLYSCTYGYVGSRATGNGGGRYLLAGPGWHGETPQGIDKVFRCETQFSLVVYRTQLMGPSDIENVKRIQAGYTVETLSGFLKQPAPPAAPEIEFPKFTAEAFGAEFPAFLDFLLRFCPEVPQEEELRARFASIGIGPGRRFDFQELSPVHKAEVAAAAKEGFERIETAAAGLGKPVNGWRISSAFGDRAFYRGNWLLRAASAKAGIYGNVAAEAMYPMTRSDADGQPLDGSKHRYTLTFAAGALPPVRAFWSVTMYDGKTQLLVENPIDRYLVNSPMLDRMKRNGDGSLTLLVQKDSPGPDKEANWLPAPDGPIYVVMRLYWPQETPPSILPVGKGSWKPPAVKRAD